LEELRKGKGTMTAPREWPNAAREARDRAAEESQAALRALEPLLKRSIDISVLGPVAQAANHTQTALRHLEAVGAQTKPL
jgi:hypothetical protein